MGLYYILECLNYLLTSFRNMVQVKGSRDFLERYFPGIHYKLKRRKDTDYVIFGHTAPGVKEFVELYAEYLFFRGVLNALVENKVKDDVDTTWLKEVHLPKIKRTLDLCWITVYNKKRGDPFIENKKQQVMYDYLKFIAYNRALTFYEMWWNNYGHLIKECNFCKQMFVATRTDSKYCDKCRNKVHAHTSRKNHKTPLASIYCGYCSKEFEPKTSRKEFCSDICRVRYHRDINSRNKLIEQMRAEEERTGIYEITEDEIAHLLEIAPGKKYLQRIKVKN